MKTTFKNLLAVSPIPWLIRESFQKKKVTIIAYHEISPETADQHLRVLKSKYNIITLKECLSAFKKRTISSLPFKPLIVTIDDGHKTNYDLLKIFMKYRIRPTIFLCSGIVGTQRHYWWKEVNDNKYLQKLKKVNNDMRLKKLVEMGYEEKREYEIRQAMSEDEIIRMKAFVDFQSHTVFHPILPRCSIERAMMEICASKLELENNFGIDVWALAYPNGDYSKREIKIAKDCGYECALTLDAGFNSKNRDLYKLKRIAIPDNAKERDLLLRVSGFWDFFKKRI
jgi:poly-beta-1,6-N-acetyl-D-glucosamine N-deacetylase